MLETFVRMYGMFRYIMRMNENGYHPRMEEIQRHCTYFEEGREELIHPNTIGDYFRRAHRFLGMKIEHDSSYGYYIRDYKDWYQDHDFLVVSFAEHLALNGGFKRIKNYTEAQKYMAYVFTTKGKDGKLDKNFPGVFIQNQMKEEEEAAHKAWIEKEKQRFPFEDYDPERGTRYVGNRLIPWDAPPRPDNHSVWDEDDCKWVDPEVLDARRAAGFARLEAMMAEMPLMTSSRLI